MNTLAEAAENGKSGFDLLNAIRKLRGLRPIERLLLLELGFHKNNQTGQCNPGYKCLAEDLELSVSAVRQTIRTLEKKGLIRKTPGFAKVSSRYAFTLPAEAFKEEKESVTSEPPRVSPEGGGVSPGDHSQCHQETTPSVTTGTEGVSPGEHQTALELRKELRREERGQKRTPSKPSFHDSKRQKARPENPAAIQAFMESEGIAPTQATAESSKMFHYYEARGWKNIVDWKAAARRWMLSARPEGRPNGGPKTLDQTKQEMEEQWDRIERFSVGDAESAETQSYDVTSPTPGARQVGKKAAGTVLTPEEQDEDQRRFERDQQRYEEAQARRSK